ncbi:MAG TPA: copper resistance CopC family protein [Acidimicrobiia bacterium]
MRGAALWLAGALVLMQAAPALAHTEFDSAIPADQAVVDDPVAEITIAFTLPVTVVGNGFEVLTPRGNIISPEVETDDDTVFTLIIDDPLAGGEVGVRYEVAAEDGHVLAGGFSFSVTAAGETTTTTTSPEPTTTTVSATTSSTSTVTTAIATKSPLGEDEGGSMTPLLVAVGAVLIGGAGLYAGIRSRS